MCVLVRSNSIQLWAPCLPPAKSGPDSALTRLTDNSKRNRRLKIYITCKDKQMTSRTFSGDYSQEFVIYTVSQKSEPPKQFATATANLHRFKWNFTHTRRHLVLSSTSNFIRDVQFFQTAVTNLSYRYYFFTTTAARSVTSTIWKNDWLKSGVVLIRTLLTEQWISGMIDCITVQVRKGDISNIWFEHFDCSDWHQLRWKLMTCG